MQEYELKILEQYDIEVKGTRKTRGAFFCDTGQGLFLLKEAGISSGRANILYRLGELLREGGARTDQLVPNAEGALISVSEDGGRYLLKRWFAGRECDVRRSRELFEGVKNLARLHLLMRMPGEEQLPGGTEPAALYESRNRELRKVRKFVRNRTCKGEFELLFLKEFDELYAWAEAAANALEESGCDRLYRESLRDGCLIHGEYNYHNILLAAGGVAAVNFERFRGNVQVEDLYYFLRKTMEKHDWNVYLCDCMLNAYSAIRPINDREMEYLKVRFLYPEKFWKTAGTYYRSNKAWISVKNVEKFRTAVIQTEKKKQLLETVFNCKI